MIHGLPIIHGFMGLGRNLVGLIGPDALTILFLLLI